MPINEYWVNLSVGVGCGVLLGWVLRGRLKPRFITKAIGDKKLEAASMEESGELKLVLVIRNDLKMGKGKMAAQCSHAAVMSYERLSRNDPDLLRDWKCHGQPKVVVKTDSEASLLELAKKAQEEGLTVSLVQDAGRTQIAPGSKTVLGVGPGPASMVDRITGHLKLL